MRPLNLQRRFLFWLRLSRSRRPRILEIWCFPCAPSDGLFTRMQEQAKKRYGLTA